jgi:hypothetical protein
MPLTAGSSVTLVPGLFCWFTEVSLENVSMVTAKKETWFPCFEIHALYHRHLFWLLNAKLLKFLILQAKM